MEQKEEVNKDPYVEIADTVDLTQVTIDEIADKNIALAYYRYLRGVQLGLIDFRLYELHTIEREKRSEVKNALWQEIRNIDNILLQIEKKL